MSSENLHEREETLSDATKNMHRAIVSLIEELDAVDWYQQRAEACSDDELKAVLIHNKNEEIEHAMMVLEWIRRNNPEFDTNIKTYLGAKGPITEIEAAAEAKDPVNEGGGGAGEAPPARRAMSAPAASGRGGSLGIGSLKGA